MRRIIKYYGIGGIFLIGRLMLSDYLMRAIRKILK